jgi:hypothetical protein
MYHQRNFAKNAANAAPNVDVVAINSTSGNEADGTRERINHSAENSNSASTLNQAPPNTGDFHSVYNISQNSNNDTSILIGIDSNQEDIYIYNRNQFNNEMLDCCFCFVFALGLLLILLFTII